MKTVTKLLLKQRDTVESVAFPEACCYCGKPASETVQTKVGNVTLNIPYCADHLEPAKEYVHKVVPRYSTIHMVVVLLLSLIIAFGAVFVLEIEGLAMQVVVAVIGFVVGFFMATQGGGAAWTTSILKTGAKKLGFTGASTLAPGIAAAQATEDPASGKVKLILAFADDAYTDLFEGGSGTPE